MCYNNNVKRDGIDEPFKATQEISRKKFQKKMKFPLDKQHKVCYNNNVRFLGHIRTARIKDSTSKRNWPTAKQGSYKYVW